MPATQQAPSSSSTARTASASRSTKRATPTVRRSCWCTASPIRTCLWDGVVPLLAERFRIIRYDNRGVGLSSAPKPVSAYTMARFADDFAAVTGELSPGRPVHVLAHDWGSVGMWEYLTRPGASDRVASFTSVSGPSQDILVDYIFSGLRQPWRPRRFARSVSQALRFTYMVFFSIPLLAPLVPPADAVEPDGAAQRGRQHPRRSDPSLRRLGQGCRPFGEDLPRQLLSGSQLPPAPARLRRAGAADRQHPGQVRAPLRLRRGRALGAAAVAPRHQSRSLFTDVASAGDGGGGARVRRPGRRQTAEPRACCARRWGARARPSATPWCRSPAPAAGSAARPRSPSRARAPRW